MSAPSRSPHVDVHGRVRPCPTGRVSDRSTAVLRRPSTRFGEGLWVAGILLAGAVAHGVNMFNFPYYESDEGTYLSQAWAVANHGQLAPYTYWYDHAPLGWVQIAAWATLTGGFHAFGTPVDSGRVLMLVLQVASTLMLYRIARSISGGVIAASIASVAFSLSAYGIYYHRRVLLDNVSTFWMLLSIAALVGRRPSIKAIWFSALALGVSVLSKEVTVILVPSLAYLVFIRTARGHRRFATVLWIAVVASAIAMYVLMAIGRGELFPAGTPLGGTEEHVSLLETLKVQASRGRDGGFLAGDSRFWEMARRWAREEPFLVIAGSMSACISAMALRRRGATAVMGLASLSLWAFLGRGGETLAFYLLPLLPLLALNAGLVLGPAVTGLKSYLEGAPGARAACSTCLKLLAVSAFLASLLAGYTSPSLGFEANPWTPWNNSQAEAHRQSVAWVTRNLASSDSMIIDPSMWTDLHDLPGGAGSYPLAHSYWKVGLDPEVRDGVFRNDWRRVDYLIVTPQMRNDAHNARLGLVVDALERSVAVAYFDTGGWPIEVRRVAK